MEEYRYLTRYTEHELRKLLPGYRKSKYNTEVLMEHIDRSIINEKKFCENIECLDNELGSNIGTLIEELKK